MKPSTNNSRIAALAWLAGITCASTAVAAPYRDAAADTTNSSPAQITLRDGDSLAGELVSIDSQGGVRWKNSDAREGFDFKPGSVAQIVLHPPPAPPRGTNYPCKVFLVNGDTLEGGLASFTRDGLDLQTWYRGQIKIPLKFLESISMLPTTPDLFSAYGPEGWTQGASPAVFAGESGNWTYRDGAFYASKSSSLARDVKLPDSAQIQFDLAWSGNLTLSFALYTDSLQPLLLTNKDNAPPFGGFYSMRFQNMFVDLARIKRAEPIISLSAVVVPAFTQTNRVHIDVRAKKKSNTVALAVNGQLIMTWTDTNGFAGEGRGLRFVHNGQGLVKISNLRVGPWDGTWEKEGTSPNPSQDTAWLTNATTLGGVLESIADGKMTFRGNRSKSDVPLSQLSRVAFAAADGEPPKTVSPNVHATLLRGNSISLRLETWGPDGVQVRSPVFGRVKFDPGVFERLEFMPAEVPDSSAGGNAVRYHLH